MSYRPQGTWNKIKSALFARGYDNNYTLVYKPSFTTWSWNSSEMSGIRVGLIFVLLVAILQISHGASVGVKVLSRVKRGKDVTKNTFATRIRGGSDEVTDCKCSFDECSCRDSAKPSRLSSADPDDWIMDMLEDINWSKEMKEESPERTEPIVSKEEQPVKDEKPAPSINRSLNTTKLLSPVRKDQEADIPTFNNYYHTKQRGEILHFLKNYYNTDSN